MQANSSRANKTMVSSIQTRQMTINEHSDTDTRGSSCLITSSKATLKHTWNNNILKVDECETAAKPVQLLTNVTFQPRESSFPRIFPLGSLMRPRAFWKAPGKKI